VPIPAAPGRILLVDDDPMIVRLVHKILAARGFAEVEHAGTGREALVTGDDEPARSAGADLVESLPLDPGTFTADLVDISTRA
jgi:DNA-binding response OmpR family regulator